MKNAFLQRRHFTLGLLTLPVAGQAAAPTRVLVVGDSLSAEYGLQRGSGWVALLQNKLISEKPQTQVINASISGDTTAGGRSRLPALLQAHEPQVVVIELGGNDALRGLDLKVTRQNLQAMIAAAKASKAKVLLLGMQMPPNYGAAYGKQFVGLYADLAKQEGTALVPFFLKDVGDSPQAASLFQADRIHPNEQAQTRLLANVWPVLKKLIP
jgi:acyl-CoA thioesterase-1